MGARVRGGDGDLAGLALDMAIRGAGGARSPLGGSAKESSTFVEELR